MRIRDILYEMTVTDAVKVFQQAGVDVQGMSVAQIKAARAMLIGKHHPDRGGDLATAQMINAAYDVLKHGTPQSSTSSNYSTGNAREQGSGTPPWAWAGFSGGLSPSASIYRNDFTDVNFIKKTMWELSGHSTQEWSIQSFDGHFFRGSCTVYGSPKIFHQMAEAMIMWETKGGNPYACRAVFVSPRKSRELLLIYADGKFYDQNPIKFEHDSFNLNPGNDQQFVRRLPELLDQLKNQG